jgi:hypothetical protein
MKPRKHEEGVGDEVEERGRILVVSTITELTKSDLSSF